MRSAVVKDKKGNSSTKTEAQQERWRRRHFSKILNIQSGFDVEELSRVRQRPTGSKMAEVPSEEEAMNAVGKLRNGKAGGESGILPELVKATYCEEEEEEEFVNKLLDLANDVCETGCVWRDSILVPIPKMGDFSNCDNSRGISLLGKVVARVSKRGFRSWLRMNCQNHSAAFRQGEAVQI